MIEIPQGVAQNTLVEACIAEKYTFTSSQQISQLAEVRAQES